VQARIAQYMILARISWSASTTCGCGTLPGLPAERAWWWSPASWRKIRSAITERPLFAT
jgi:hypothetical protein